MDSPKPQIVEPGTKVTFSKTVGESDVYLFAGITGDLHANHVNDEYMKKTRYGQRVAHGALLVGFMSNCSTQITRLYQQPGFYWRHHHGGIHG
jgi:3-hydroxybutyryl-CoA dehydratase